MNLNYKFIGWCKEDNHDKVWVVIRLGKNDQNKAINYKWATIWGRRGKKLRYLISDDFEKNIESLINQKKQNKGYREINIEELNTVYPEFETDLEKIAIWAILKG